MDLRGHVSQGFLNPASLPLFDPAIWNPGRNSALA